MTLEKLIIRVTVHKSPILRKCASLQLPWKMHSIHTLFHTIKNDVVVSGSCISMLCEVGIGYMQGFGATLKDALDFLGL